MKTKQIQKAIELNYGFYIIRQTILELNKVSGYCSKPVSGYVGSYLIDIFSESQSCVIVCKLTTLSAIKTKCDFEVYKHEGKHLSAIQGKEMLHSFISFFIEILEERIKISKQNYLQKTSLINSVSQLPPIKHTYQSKGSLKQNSKVNSTGKLVTFVFVLIFF